MKRAYLIAVGIILCFTLAQGQSKLETNFQKLTTRILDNLNSYYAVQATARGIHDYDYKFTDYSKGGIKREIRALKDFEVRLHKYSKSKLSRDSEINRRLLKSNVDLALHELARLKRYKTNPYIYVDEAVNGIYYLVTSEYAPIETRIHNIIARMRLVPDLLSQAKKNLKEPAPSFMKMAKELIGTGAEFFRSVEEEMCQRLPELAQDIHRSADDAVASLEGFEKFLDQIKPGTDESVAIGKEAFDYKLKTKYMLEFDSDSLLKLGEALFSEYYKKYQDYSEELKENNSGIDSVFVLDCLTKDDILRYYQWETDQTRLFLSEKDLIDIPEDIGYCKVTETPEFLRNVISSIAYHPPGVFSSDQTGYFYVRPIPDNMDSDYIESRYKYINRRGFKSSVVHEAFPGHHLQFQLASKIVNPVRKFQENACFYEGWALYCEEMMYEQGFYDNDKRAYLKILGGIAFRAARIIVDVKLQTRQWNREEAIAWMVENLESSKEFCTKEINWYTLQPTVPMSYLIGKIEILNLLEAYKKQAGDTFKLKDFHNKLHANGAVAPAVLWKIWGLEK